MEKTHAESVFEQITPLLDDVIMLVTETKLHPYEHATIVALSATHLSAMTALSMLRCDYEEIDDGARERLDAVLATKIRETDDLLATALQHFVSGAKVS